MGEERRAAAQARGRAKPAWTIEPATAEGLLAYLGVAESPFAAQYAAIQRFAKTPDARGMPSGVRSELRRRNLLASVGSGRIEEMESLAGIRAQIDRLDQEIVALLAERGAYVRQAARFKRTEAEARAPERVEQVIGRVRELAEQWRLSPEVAERVYRAMIGAFVELELAEVMERRRERPGVETPG